MSHIGDYDQKILLASKALQNKPTSKQPRLPNPTWSGLGFSSSMPECSIRGRFRNTKCKHTGQQV